RRRVRSLATSTASRRVSIRRTSRYCRMSASSSTSVRTSRHTSSIFHPETETMRNAIEDANRRLLRARDAMDRTYAQPLDIPALAQIAYVSEAHFIRTFRSTFGETPHRYLQRRRVERSMFLLRETDRSITDICLDVGFASLGTFSRTFRAIVGEAPSAYRRATGPFLAPGCIQMLAMRPLRAAGSD